MNKNWYAVYTRPQCEKKVAAQLSKKRIENFCPVNRLVYNNQQSRRKPLSEPLFPSFVFVYITEAEINQVRQVNDVINFIYWLGKPAVIKQDEIAYINNFSNNYFNLSLTKTTVNIAGTAYTNLEPKMDLKMGVVAARTSVLKATLPSLGYILCAEVESADTSVTTFNYGMVGDNMAL
jgi:transcription antitermination factor NusG